MRIAVVGSRNLRVENTLFTHYLTGADEIVSGGAKGIDLCAAEYAKNNNIPFTEFLPEYAHYGRAAPIIRNKRIVDYADKVIVFWDGASRGTLSVIQYAEKVNKPCQVIVVKE